MFQNINFEVKYFPFQAHCFAFGGFDMQMINAMSTINELNQGVHINGVDLWDIDSSFQIAHFWGLDITHYNHIIWAKRSGKKVVITALLGYFENLHNIFRHHLSSYIGIVRILKKIISSIDALVVVSEVQKQIAIKMYNCPPEKIFVIPNMVLQEFWVSSISIKSSDYFLSVGNICHRKNQVKLAQACIQADVKLTLVGEVLDGEEEYGIQLEELVTKSNNITWIKGLRPASSELIELINNSMCVALLSDQETQPISLLEAAVLQKPLLISDRKFADQIYYRNACLIDDQKIDSIVNGLNLVKVNPGKFVPDKNILQMCKPEVVGEAYIRLYKSLTLD